MAIRLELDEIREGIPPTLGSRIVAFAWDYLIISAYLVVLTVATVLIMLNVNPETWQVFFSNSVRADLVAFFTTVLPVVLYFSISESSAGQASWGKRKKQLVVQHRDGRRLSFGMAFIRSVLKFLPWQIAHTCLFNIPGWPLSPDSPPNWIIGGFVLVWVLVFVNGISVVFTRSRGALYDRILDLQVVQAQ